MIVLKTTFCLIKKNYKSWLDSGEIYEFHLFENYVIIHVFDNGLTENCLLYFNN